MTAAITITRATAIFNSYYRKYENVICKGDGNKQKNTALSAHPLFFFKTSYRTLIVRKKNSGRQR